MENESVFGVAKGNYALVQLSEWLDERGVGERFELSRFPTGHYFLRIAVTQPANAFLAVRKKSWLLVAGTEQRSEEVVLPIPLDSPPETTGAALVSGVLDAATVCQRWAPSVGLGLAVAAYLAADDLNLRVPTERAFVDFIARDQYSGSPDNVIAEAQQLVKKFGSQADTPWTAGA